MSRAFMKEGEPEDPRCPACGSLGEAVGAPTLEALLGPAERAALAAPAFWCPAAACPTGWFNAWGAAVPAARLQPLPWPKNPQGAICACFGVTAEDVVADARAGRKDRVRELREKAEGPGAACARRAPDGRCCLPAVMRLFRESFEAR